MSHSDIDMDMCSMNMLFNVDYHNLCIIFPSWHIRSLPSFLFSLLAIVILGAGYEAVREISRRVEAGASNPIKLTDRSPDRKSDSPNVVMCARYGYRARAEVAKSTKNETHFFR